jgi:hypothetical protein
VLHSIGEWYEDSRPLDDDAVLARLYAPLRAGEHVAA